MRSAYNQRRKTMTTIANSKSDSTVQAVLQLQEDQRLSDQLQDSVSAGIAKAAPFDTHSLVLARKLVAEADGYKAMIADIDDKLERLNEERTDLMLAYSMLSAAAGARERGK